MIGDLFLDAVRDVLALGPDERVPLTITVEQAGKVLGVSRGLAYQSARDGSLPTVKLGRRRLVVPVARLRSLLDGTAPENTNGALPPDSLHALARSGGGES